MTVTPVALRLLDGLDDAQRDAVTCSAKTVRVSAGPGSGKTRVLTRRIAWQVATGQQDPRRILALTFTRAAAREMRRRLAQLGVHDVTTATLHASCLALWTQRLRDTGRYLPALVKDRRRLLTAALDAEDGDSGESSGADGWDGWGEQRLGAEELEREVTWANSRALTPVAYAAAAVAAGRDLPVPASVVAEALERYELIKRKRGVVDFDDLLLLVLHELRTDRQWAAAQRWRFQHLYVDEYQDLTLTQRALLRELAGGDDTDGAGDLFVVGDPHQAIFGFSGAEADGFDNFAGEFPDAALLTLAANHRSAPIVVTAAKTVIDSGMEATRNDLSGRVTVTGFPSEADEARAVTRQLRAAGRPFSHRAVLARTNHALDAVEAACLQAGIPVERQQDLLRRPEIRQALAEVRRLGLGRPAAGLRHDLLDIGAEILAAFEGGEPARYDDRPHGWADSDPAADAHPDGQVESFEYILARHHLDELSDLVSEYATFAPAAPVESFLFWLNATANGTGAARQVRGAVSLRTIHRAKGLEWSDVWVVGCEEDLLPLRNADADEERRLAYVAMSRAVKNLHCSWAEQRSAFGRARMRVRSRFVAELAAEQTVGSVQEAFSNAERVAAIREELAAVPEPQRREPPREVDRGPLVRAIERRVQLGEDVRSAVLEVLALQWKTSVEGLEARADDDVTFARELSAVMLTMSSLCSVRRSA